MKKSATIKILLLAAICVLIINITAAVIVGLSVYFAKDAIALSAVVKSLIIMVFTINSALIAAVILFLTFRKA